MKLKEFMQTIYLGDRGCKSILIDGWNSEVKIQITCISRVRSDTWDFYTDEDLDDGKLVFTGVKSVVLNPPGCIPNSYVEIISIEELADSLSEVVFAIGADDGTGGTVLANLSIRASQLHLEDSDGRKIES